VQKSVRAWGDSNSNVAVELPLTLIADEAKQLAERALREPWRQRLTVRFSVGPAYDFLLAGQLISLEIGGVYTSGVTISVSVSDAVSAFDNPFAGDVCA